MKTLREALENSGVDLTKASISVEIELAKQSSSSFKVYFSLHLVQFNTLNFFLVWILIVSSFVYYSDRIKKFVNRFLEPETTT